MVAVSAAKHNVALRNIAPLAHLWLLDNTKQVADGVSASSVMPILMNVFSRVFESVCEKVAKSEHLSITIDGTSDVRQRNPIAIRLGGVYENSPTPWSFPFHFCEPGDHKAETQLNEIQKLLETVNLFNEGKGARKITVVDIEAIVFDTTSSNTGKKKGLAGLLTKARQREWKEQNKPGTVPKLVIKGCEDHILNLMSRDFETALVRDATPDLVVGKKHRATDIVQLLIWKVRRMGRSFRHFMTKEFEVTKFTIPRISDTRLVDLLLSYLLCAYFLLLF